MAASDPLPPVQALVDRLERERQEADRRYNDALTAVDAAIQVPPPPAAPMPEVDAERLADLNRWWDLLPTDGLPSVGRGWVKRRLRAFIWRLLGPSVERQKQFNAALIDHLNRNHEGERIRARALQSLVERTRQDLIDLVRFESLLVQYLQTITIYVDSRDRAVGGSQIRERLALNEQRLLALKRMVERPDRERVFPAAPPSAQPAPQERVPGAFDGEVDSLTYVAFEDRFRGAESEIGRRVEAYLPLLSSAADVVDIGCGRGELLAAFATRGITARGVDVNPAMVELARAKGLAAEQGDALSYMRRQAAASVGGLVAIQVVEHFTPAYLKEFLDASFAAMRPGAPLVLETINPACWMAFFETYLRDLTHRQPLHAETLKLMVEAAGFSDVDVQFRQPVGDADRLQRAIAVSAGAEMDAITAILNDHADKLNARIFSFMDYAVVARR